METLGTSHKTGVNPLIIFLYNTGSAATSRTDRTLDVVLFFRNYKTLSLGNNLAPELVNIKYGIPRGLDKQDYTHDESR